MPRRPAARPGTPRASVVIPVYNQLSHTRICLAGLSQSLPDYAEVVVVDNGSARDTAEFLEVWARRGGGRRVVTAGSNLGFARGCNLGAQAAAGRFVVFLNNDTFVLEHWLERLLEPLEEGRAEIAGSLLLYPNDRVQHAGIAFDELGPHHVFAGLRRDSPAVVKEREWQAVTGAALAIERARFDSLGGFDDAYVNSFEDVDLCLRARAQGWRVLYEPESVAYHFEGMTEGRQGLQDRRNYDLFISRWRGRFEIDLRAAQAAAEADGVDLTDREPPKVELRQANAEIEARLAAAEAELSDYRRLVGRRMLAAMRAARRAVPASVRRRLRPSA